jgi:exoribonuclease-2
MLESGDEELSMLYQFAASRESERIAAGAVRIAKREAGIEIDSDGRVSIYEVNESTPARMLVGELMIFANTLAAEFAAVNGLALFFRSQEPPDEDLAAVGAHLPDGPARAYAMRGKLKPSSTTATPAAHSSLAVSAYAQVTSPIRRYSDLINQRQIAHYLKHRAALYSAEEISILIAETVEPLKSALLINRETRRYWLIKYLKQLAKNGQTIKGTVVRTDMKYPLIELEKVFLTTVLKTDLAFPLGAEVNVKIAKADPREDYLRVELV